MGAERLIRVGTCGGIGRGIKTGEIVIATAASPVDGATRTYSTAIHTLPRPTSAGPIPGRDGREARPDATRRPGCDGRRLLQSGSGLLLQMAKPRRAGFRNGDLGLVLPGFPEPTRTGPRRWPRILTVSDVLSEEATSEESYMPLDELNRSIERTIEIALEAGIAELSPSGSTAGSPVESSAESRARLARLGRSASSARSSNSLSICSPGRSNPDGALRAARGHPGKGAARRRDRGRSPVRGPGDERRAGALSE